MAVDGAGAKTRRERYIFCGGIDEWEKMDYSNCKQMDKIFHPMDKTDITPERSPYETDSCRPV